MSVDIIVEEIARRKDEIWGAFGQTLKQGN